VNGTWQTTGGSGGPSAGLVAVAVAAAVVGAAVAAWIITKLLLIALITVALLVIAVMVVLVVRRIRHPEGAVQLARQGPALRADVEMQAVEARPAAAGVHYHGGTHLHIEAGADAAAVLRQADLLRTDVRNYPLVDP
jgi:hypothetical protein